jgi:dipeptidyl aminopeptidase/acylaminoacyl peptidase
VGGVTPYEHLEAFGKYNPINHMANWTQPMLIIHGRHDYRVKAVSNIYNLTMTWYFKSIT